MFKKAVLLLVVLSFVVCAMGCGTYNTSNVSPTATLRRVAIMGEQLRIVSQDVDYFFELDQYPQMNYYNR